jgi:hypothetical protein
MLLIAVAIDAMVELAANVSCWVPALPAISSVTPEAASPAPVNVRWPWVALLTTSTTTLWVALLGSDAELICTVPKALVATLLVV